MPEKTEPDYRSAIVTFIDLLGFKNILKQRTATQIRRALRRARENIRSEPEKEKQFEEAFFAFSDSMLRIKPLDSRSNLEVPTGVLFDELLTLVHAQANLVLSKVFLRGGMTLGEVEFDEQTAFGPAVVRAYELESKSALYPRIVVDPRLLQALDTEPLLWKDGHSSGYEKKQVRKLVHRDRDGFWFVNYLKAFE
ncbi:MAG: hypothetical protein OK454_11795, partial [Thaumarchaeota archaeon]|nr:hypothetical protein [Nitrososphaerota archaeon]